MFICPCSGLIMACIPPIFSRLVSFTYSILSSPLLPTLTYCHFSCFPFLFCIFSFFLFSLSSLISLFPSLCFPCLLTLPSTYSSPQSHLLFSTLLLPILFPHSFLPSSAFFSPLPLLSAGSLCLSRVIIRVTAADWGLGLAVYSRQGE